MSSATSPFDAMPQLADAPDASQSAVEGERRRAVAVAREHLARANSSLALAERCLTDLSSRLHSLQRRLEGEASTAAEQTDEVQRQIDVAMESLTALAGTAMAAGYEADAAARCAATALASIGALDPTNAPEAPTPKVDGKTIGLLQTVAPSHLGNAQAGRLSSITRHGCNSIASGHRQEARHIVSLAVDQMASLHDDLLQFKGATLGSLRQQLAIALHGLDHDASTSQTIGLTVTRH